MWNFFEAKRRSWSNKKKIKPREKKQIQQQHTRSRPTTTTIKRRSKQASGNNNRRKKQKPCNCVNKNVLNYISFGEMCESRCVREYECVCQRMWVRDKWNFLCFPLRGRKKESRNEVALKQKEKTAPLSPKKNVYVSVCVWLVVWSSMYKCVWQWTLSNNNNCIFCWNFCLIYYKHTLFACFFTYNKRNKIQKMMKYKMF